MNKIQSSLERRSYQNQLICRSCLILQNFNENGLLPDGIRVSKVDSSPVFCLKNLPSFYFIRGALSLEEQCKWIKETLTKFPQPPNRTNHNAIYGPIADLFDSAKENKVLVQEDLTNNKWNFYEEDIAKAKQRSCKSVSTSLLLRKLRWSTLGLQFDWSKPEDLTSSPYFFCCTILVSYVPRAIESLYYVRYDGNWSKIHTKAD